MSSLSLTLEMLEEKLDNLLRDTRFCVNNYDYHHENNEHEIVENFAVALKDALQEGQQFLSSMENMRSSIDEARKKCCEADRLLMQFSVRNESSVSSDSCPIGSRSFNEEQEAIEYPVDENKENLI